jgi:hypothetical protein
MGRPRRKRPIRDALFLDIPYIIDSACRHGDQALNGLHRYTPGGGPAPLRTRRYAALPPFWCFLLVLLFCAYGATLGAFCGVLGAANVEALRGTLGTLCILASFAVCAVAIWYFHGRIQRRYSKCDIQDGWRKAVVYIVTVIVLGVWSSPLFFFGLSLLDKSAFDVCLPVTDNSTWTQLGLFVAACVAAMLAALAIQHTRWRVLAQAAVLAIVFAVLWTLFGADEYREAAQVPYRHLYSIVAIGFAVVACLAATVLIHIPFYSMKKENKDAYKPFTDALKTRELFAGSRKDPELSPRRIIGGCVIGVLQRPMQFLLLPAFAIILVPSGFIWHACIAGTLASALLITASNLTVRWDQMSLYLRRYFLLGTPLVVSAVVVVIAASRLANVQYVATILNVAPFGVLFSWMVMAYVLGWWFEYQINSVLATRLLEILGGDGTTDTAAVPYVPGPTMPNDSNVKHEARYLTAHATGQFLVLGWFDETKPNRPTTAFNTFGFVEFFSKLFPADKQDAAREVERRIQLYFALVNATLVIGLVWLYWHFGHDDDANTVKPVITAKQGPSEHSTDLAALLRASPKQKEPAIVIAASGGGTRAALYTATVLHGLHKLKADKDIVLLSGVSGGGVAAAYFYGHRNSLLRNVPQRCDALDESTQDPWQCYLDRMAMPFIRDVMQGAGEWRIQSEQPLGVLLAESFERRLFAADNRKIGDDTELGLILNTTMTAHPAVDSLMLNGALVQPQLVSGPCQNYQRPLSILAGGRLAFTNVRDVGAFHKTSEEASGIQLPFVVVQDEKVALAQAAALNANFPPVFPNARVDLTDYPTDATTKCSVRSYYVTDGGATENLGLLSALLALKSALTKPGLAAPLRDIDIVLAEASAIDYDYHQDRGVGAATGQSKERLTGRLTLELLDQVQQAARAIDPHATVRIHDLSLPRVFRSRGGFGTHWMFPESVQVQNPLPSTLPSAWKQTVAQYSGLERYWVTLDKKDLLTLWQGLHDPTANFCSRKWCPDPYADLHSVSSWICGRDIDEQTVATADPHQQRWRELVDSLRSRQVQ